MRDTLFGRDRSAVRLRLWGLLLLLVASRGVASLRSGNDGHVVIRYGGRRRRGGGRKGGRKDWIERGEVGRKAVGVEVGSRGEPKGVERGAIEGKLLLRVRLGRETEVQAGGSSEVEVGGREGRQLLLLGAGPLLVLFNELPAALETDASVVVGEVDVGPEGERLGELGVGDLGRFVSVRGREEVEVGGKRHGSEGVGEGRGGGEREEEGRGGDDPCVGVLQ